MPSLYDYLFGNPYGVMQRETQQDIENRRGTMLNPTTPTGRPLGTGISPPTVPFSFSPIGATVAYGQQQQMPSVADEWVRTHANQLLQAMQQNPRIPWAQWLGQARPADPTIDPWGTVMPQNQAMDPYGVIGSTSWTRAPLGWGI